MSACLPLLPRNDLVLQYIDECLRAIIHLQLVKDAREMVLDRLFGEPQRLADVLIR